MFQFTKIKNFNTDIAIIVRGMHKYGYVSSSLLLTLYIIKWVSKGEYSVLEMSS